MTINVKTVRYNNVEFKAGTAALFAPRGEGSEVRVCIVAQSHSGHQILVDCIGGYYTGHSIEFDDLVTRNKLEAKAIKIIRMLNS